jgi:hypothetical protein
MGSHRSLQASNGGSVPPKCGVLVGLNFAQPNGLEAHFAPGLEDELDRTLCSRE